jgi:hypothetical protein
MGTLRDEIETMLDENVSSDPFVLLTRALAEAGKPVSTPPMDMLRMVAQMVHDLRRACIRLAEEIEQLPGRQQQG